MTRRAWISSLFLAVVVFGFASVSRAEYTIGVDDVLQIVFWQSPELNQTVAVNSDGKITLAVTGEITAAGLSPSALGRKIVEQVSRFNRDISQATVTVVQYNSQTVFVEGEVTAPGRYSREVIPDLWTIIKEMGGVTQFGDLRNVKVIRGGTVDPGKILVVDVSAAVSNRDVTSLPKIYPHDIVQIPRTISSTPSAGIPSEAGSANNVYYVLGAVAKPGVYTLQPGLGVVEAIALAGGTAVTADLKGIRINSKVGDKSNVYRVNLDKKLKSGSIVSYALQPEDAIVVPEKGGSVLGVSFGAVRDVITFGSTIISTYLLIDRINRP